MSSRRQPSIPPKIPGYEYVRLLGMGGFADVFEYRQELPRRSVAVKVLLGGSLDQDAREAFFGEANVMAQLSHHPSIVTIYQADIAADGRPFLVMEYCSRPSLGARYRTERFTVAEVLRTGIRVASAVEAAHRLGILHRDIKPANILATDFGWPALTDFGIASTLGSSAAATGMSIPWSAPELLAEHPVGDARGDVYSLGATLYTLVAGRSPFELIGRSNTPAELLSRIERSPLPPIQRQDVPAGLAAVLARSMAKDAERRFSSALALAHALQQVERSMQLPVTSIDLAEVTPAGGQPDVHGTSGSSGTFSDPDFDGGVDDSSLPGADQATRMRPITSIAPYAGGGTSSDDAARAAALDDESTRLRPITTISPGTSGAPAAQTGGQQVDGPAGPAPAGGVSVGTVSAPSGETSTQVPGSAHGRLPSVAGFPPAPGAAQFSHEPGAQRTRHYARSTDPSLDDSPAPVSIGRRIVAAGSVVVVVVALLLVAYETVGRDALANPQETQGATQAPTLVGGSVVPGPTNLVGVVQGDGTAVFEWTNPDAQDGDAYLWRIDAPGSTSPVERIDSPLVTVDVPQGQDSVCIEVSIVRSDGRATTTPVEGCTE
ncbi:serine/threonine-protein kinase [Sanguibacter antarcticus]|uniref:non-specific serine/threonine protein kinase n=1 Tax=Sanguibacter antarcticus TaxID=372484 RepID=A0A2A9E601_9MICO|nr:serine/threonine-protein kinase [Sanguibacter antarcticus]PFG34274.1 serine/threonine protein kinase [Sanguibacter antarcticus]